MDFIIVYCIVCTVNYRIVFVKFARYLCIGSVHCIILCSCILLYLGDTVVVYCVVSYLIVLYQIRLRLEILCLCIVFVLGCV